MSRSNPASGRYTIGNPYGGEIIPAIEESRSPDPNRRESVMRAEHVCDDSARIIYDPRYYKGEAVLRLGCSLPEPSNFNQWLADVRKIGNVKSVVLLVCPMNLAENWHWFRVHEFERCEARERGEYFVLVGPARQM